MATGTIPFFAVVSILSYSYNNSRSLVRELKLFKFLIFDLSVIKISFGLKKNIKNKNFGLTTCLETSFMQPQNAERKNEIYFIKTIISDGS